MSFKDYLKEAKPKLFRDWVPREFNDTYSDSRAAKYLDVPIIKEYGYQASDGEKRWPSKEKFVFNWVILENNIAIGWNENPARGWSFPVKKMKM